MIPFHLRDNGSAVSAQAHDKNPVAAAGRQQKPTSQRHLAHPICFENYCSATALSCSIDAYDDNGGGGSAHA